MSQPTSKRGTIKCVEFIYLIYLDLHVLLFEINVRDFIHDPPTVNVFTAQKLKYHVC